MALEDWVHDSNAHGSLPIGIKKYREIQLSRKCEFGDSSQAKLTYQVDWSQYKIFVKDLLGYSELVGGAIERILPQQHPEAAYYYADSCTVTPKNRTQSTGQSDYVTVETTFRPRLYQLKQDSEITSELDRYVTRKTVPKADYLQLNINSYKWVSRAIESEKPLAATPGKIAPSRTLEYTWHEVPCRLSTVGDPSLEYRCPTENNILRLLGKTNISVFDGVYKIGTVLFVGAEAELMMPRRPDGLYTWQIKYIFEQKDNGIAETGEEAGVNYIYDPIYGRWDLITTNGETTGQRLYNLDELNDLFVIS